MKKSAIIKHLTYVDASYVKLIVCDPLTSLILEGSFTPVNAMRIIRRLPSKFEYQCTPIE